MRRGPELLPALREAGVVDAGGYGVVVLFAGCVAALRGDEPPDGRPSPRARARHAPRARVLDLPLLHELRRHRGRRRRARRRELVRRAARGDRRLGARRRRPRDAARPRPHQRAGGRDRDLRGRRRGLAARRRRHARAGRRPRPAARRAGEQPPSARSAAARWRSSPARGLAAMYRSLGCDVLDGGTTMNPSTYDILAGIHSGPRRGGRRAAQQPQRRDGRAGRRGHVRQGRARRARAPSSRPASSPPSR